MSELIDRQAAIEAIHEADNTAYDDRSFVRDALMNIRELPPVQPERKTGKWIRGKCDQCGAHAPFWPMASTYYESDYCPNCGSEMRGDDHETD